MALSRHAQPARRSRRKIAALIVIVAGLVLVGGSSLYWFAAQRNANPALAYRPEDIARDQPLHAVHEMDMPGMEMSKPIPFLPQDGPQPSIAIPVTFYDFGSIGPTEIVKRDFVIVNRGQAPLTISRAYTSCDCTSADFTSAVIPPGRVSLVTIQFDAGFHKEAAGTTVQRTLIIQSNDPNNSQLEITIQADVRKS
jgi:hypothetical protein